MTGITLSAAQRKNLLSLQDTQVLADRTNIRLATGKRVNNVADDAVNFFRSRALSQRADDFGLRQDNIAQGIEALQATLTAIDGVDALLKQLRGITEATRSQLGTERIASTTQFKELFKQISLLINDASYQGLNLLNTTSNKLVVFFGTKTTSVLEVRGLTLNAYSAVAGNNSYVSGFNSNHLFTSFLAFQANANGSSISVVFSRIFTASFGPGSTPGFSNIGNNNSNVLAIDKTVTRLDAAVTRLRAHAAIFGSNSSILTTRQTFTRNYINTLRTGSDALVLADLNEEAASSVVLQTRQQLGINALKLSGQQTQAIVSLIQ